MKKMSNLTLRILTSIILAPLILVLIIASVRVAAAMWILRALIIVVFSLAALEWARITKSAKKKWAWRITGIVYILAPAFYFLSATEFNPISLAFLLLVVWATDIGGYTFGKLIGGPKLAPKISPNKTWAGVAGGFIFAAVATLIPGMFVPHVNMIIYLAISALVISLVAQLGDLFESWVKRQFGVKDSGSIIPGHGGVLDRIDGLLAVGLVSLILGLVGRFLLGQ